MGKVAPNLRGGRFMPNSTWLWLLWGYRWSLLIKGHKVGQRVSWRENCQPLLWRELGPELSSPGGSRSCRQAPCPRTLVLL